MAAVKILGKVVGDPVAAEDGGGTEARDLKILRAELSSKSPSEMTSDKTSTLSPHQMSI